MDIGRIEKQLVCTIKDSSIDSAKIFLIKLLKLNKSETGKYVVAVDSELGLGVGDIVLVVLGGAARRLAKNSNMPVDAGISAKVETINIESKYEFLL